MHAAVYLSRAENILIPVLWITYGLFLLGFFYIPNGIDLYKFFTLTVFLPGLLMLPTGWCLLKSDHLFLLVLLYLGYMLASSCWSQPFTIKEFWHYLRLAAYIVMFILLMAVLRHKYADAFPALLRFLCTGAGVAAAVSILLWYQDHPFPSSRLVGLGILVNPNPSGLAYGCFAIVAAQLALRASALMERLFFLAIATVLCCFVWFTQSRTALIAVILALIFLGVSIHRDKSNLFFIGWLASILIGGSVFFGEALLTLFNRDISPRTIIWSSYLADVMQAPLFGHGYLNHLTVYVPAEDVTYDYAHSAYLAALRDGGVVGLLLMLTILLYAGRRALQIGNQSGDYLYLILLTYGMICMIPETDKLITRPRELWLILWLVLALIMTHHRAKA